MTKSNFVTIWYFFVTKKFSSLKFVTLVTFYCSASCFKQVWLEDEGCHEIVHSAWRSDYGASLMDKVAGKIRKC